LRFHQPCNDWNSAERSVAVSQCIESFGKSAPGKAEPLREQARTNAALRAEGLAEKGRQFTPCKWR